MYGILFYQSIDDIPDIQSLIREYGLRYSVLLYDTMTVESTDTATREEIRSFISRCVLFTDVCRDYNTAYGFNTWYRETIRVPLKINIRMWLDTDLESL